MNKIKMIVIVAIAATITSCGTPTKQESAYELDSTIESGYRTRVNFIAISDTSYVYNDYNIAIAKMVTTRWSRSSNITELHADGALTCDTVWITLERFLPVNYTYKCDE